MKKLVSIILGSFAMASAVYSQGAFNFNNLAASGTVAIVVDGVPGPQGHTGDYVGSTYNASLYYSLTPISGSVDPTTLTLVPGESAVPFFGTTGPAPAHGPTVDGAGLFDNGSAAISGTVDGQIVYVEVAAWYASAGSFSAARASGYLAGYSPSVAIRLASGTDMTIANLSSLGAFTLDVIPEPSTFAFGGLGAAAFLLLRRRKGQAE
jgi:hypothetical protein